MDDANFGSSLGREPVTLHEIHDHHVVFQRCTERSDLEGRGVHGRSRMAGGTPVPTGFCRNSRVLHDTRGLVTSAHESGRHDFLCLVQVLSVAGGSGGRVRGAHGSNLSLGFPAAETLVRELQLHSVQGGYVARRG